MSNTAPIVFAAFMVATADTQVREVCRWAADNVKLPGSARSERFNPDITPWLKEPIERLNDPDCRRVTLVKPVQSGGSTVGEVALCFWLHRQDGGDVQYNWRTDESALERWDKRIERTLKACRRIVWPDDLNKTKRGLVMFPTRNFIMQGVMTEGNLDSDSIRFQINEEIHSWEPGRLAKAKGRTTAFWNSVVFNISNAGKRGDQLSQEFDESTQQKWEVKCPGCGEYHVMRTRWEPEKAELGGLRYDADGCRLGDSAYDYNKLEKTIRYQMPCGYEVRDTVHERRALSMSGRYSKPVEGAHLSHRGYTYDAVAVDYISWLNLIKEKHVALRARRRGDIVPWQKYVTERECIFYDPEDVPIVGRVVVSRGATKNREGLKGRLARFFALDRQRGNLAAGEVPYWWLLMRDVMPNGDSMLVYEGKLLTDDDVIAALDEHDCLRRCGVADSGWDTTHVYQFCYRYGINAIKGNQGDLFSHGDEGKKIFSRETPLHTILNIDPKYSYVSNGEGGLMPHPDEPLFWHYSKAGIRDRLAWLRSGGEIKWEVPGDVSNDYKSHMESEEYRVRSHSRTNEPIGEWVQLKRRNDLFVCECYVAMLMEMAGLIGAEQEVA